LLASDVYTRPRVFETAMLATFPAVGGISTIVVGPPSLTKKTSTAWVLTLLHEHFHQYQATRPEYYTGVNGLGLARGDNSGMWMLNYPFPYDSAAVQARFSAYTASLLRALTDAGSTSTELRAARAALRSALSPEDDRYLSFQLWQEGVSRYTELRIAKLAAARFASSSAFRALPDFIPFAAQAEMHERAMRLELEHLQLGQSKRVLFYPAGAGTALLLDRLNPAWHDKYFAQPFSLDAYWP
jgi:hypothetical protein